MAGEGVVKWNKILINLPKSVLILQDSAVTYFKRIECQWLVAYTKY